MRGSALEVEVSEHFPIRQWSQQQLLREIFFGDRSQGSFGMKNWGKMKEREYEDRSQKKKEKGHEME
jgi:hypothetical protein